MVLEVEDVDYQRGEENLRFSGVGRLSLQKGQALPPMEVKNKLSDYWKITDFKFIALGKGTFHILLYSLQDQCKTLSFGAVLLKLVG